MPPRREKEHTDEKKDQVDMDVSPASLDIVEDDLDPVALNKAFKFAAWSSLSLVSGFSVGRQPR